MRKIDSADFKAKLEALEVEIVGLEAESGVVEKPNGVAETKFNGLNGAAARALRVDDGTTAEHSDFRNAEKLIEWHGQDIRYCASWGKWLAWDGKRWALDSMGPHHRAKETARRILAIAFDGQAKANKEFEDAVQKQAEEGETDANKKALDDAKQKVAWAAEDVKYAMRQSAARIESMLKVAKSDPRLAIHHSELDANLTLLNVENGTIDLREGILREHRREDFITKLAPVTYEDGAKAPTWMAFLERVMGGDSVLVDFLQRFVGYALTGDVSEHVLVFFYGGGANGKSTFLGTIHAMLGEYATPAPRHLLFKSRTERHPTELAMLHGRRFVTCSEIEEGLAFDEALVKDLTGGDPISARRMQEDFWTFVPTHKLFLSGNHKPVVRGDDEGVWRRMRLVPWTVTIPEGERDTTLARRLRNEFSGILSWAVCGCLAWRNKGLMAPEKVKAATKEYRDENDSLKVFFDSRLVFEEAGRVTRASLRLVYELFCEETGAEPLGARRFCARLRERGAKDTMIRSEGKPCNAWAGVRLKSDAELMSETEEGKKETAARTVGQLSLA